jgi:hypothetical protein
MAAFWRNMSPPSSEYKRKLRKKPAEAKENAN